MKYKIGDTINLNGLKGRIEKASINSKIGFQEERKREPMYTLVFEEIPESAIVEDDTDTTNPTKPEETKGESDTRQG